MRGMIPRGLCNMPLQWYGCNFRTTSCIGAYRFLHTRASQCHALSQIRIYSCRQQSEPISLQIYDHISPAEEKRVIELTVYILRTLSSHFFHVALLFMMVYASCFDGQMSLRFSDPPERLVVICAKNSCAIIMGSQSTTAEKLSRG